jgi:hypothetical protein
MNIIKRLRWSLGRGNPVVPSRWQATARNYLLGGEHLSRKTGEIPRARRPTSRAWRGRQRHCCVSALANNLKTS